MNRIETKLLREFGKMVQVIKKFDWKKAFRLSVPFYVH